MGWPEEEGHTGQWAQDYCSSDSAQTARRLYEEVSTIGQRGRWLSASSEVVGRNWFSTGQRKGCREGSQPGTKGRWLLHSTNERRLDMGKDILAITFLLRIYRQSRVGGYALRITYDEVGWVFTVVK